MTIPIETNDAVEEVIRFVETGQVLAKPFLPDGFDIFWTTRTITSLENVERFRDPDWPESQLKGNMAWLDIRRIDEHKNPDISDSEIWKTLERINKALYHCLEDQLVPLISEYEMQEIAGYFDHLIFLRTPQGRTDCFDEKLFRVYQAGGYPCGWAGSYPEGELVVFSRQ